MEIKMAELKLSGQALIDEVNATVCPSGEFAFWWLGQNGFIFKGGDVVFYVDPYISERPERQTPPALKPEEVTNATVVLCSHDHSDHLDRGALPGLAAASPNAVFVVPKPAIGTMVALGIAEDRVIGCGHLDPIGVCGLRVTGVKTRHERFDEDPQLGFPYLGYVVECNGVTFYHAGDANIYDGLVPMLTKLDPQAAFLPINGRDAERLARNCLGNMTFQEAVDLAGDINVEMAVPMHWDMFAGNSEDPQKFASFLAAKFPQIRTWVGPVGEKVLVRDA